MEQQIKVTYIGHSGFAVETEKYCLWFDVIAQEEETEEKPYAKGELPEIPKDKPLIIFISHVHHDHYCTKIWELRKEKEDIFFVLARDIALSPAKCRRLGLTEEDKHKILRVSAGKIYELPQFDIKIEGFKSTDVGVAFYVTVDGITLFHAGDLHAWYWLEEGEAYVADMKARFEKQLDLLKGRKTDIAFLLLDPRLGETMYEGIDRYLETMEVRYTFPMHLWKQYGLIERYKKDRADTPYVGSIQMIQRENEIFSILL